MSVIKYITIRVTLAFVAYYDWKLEQLDVKIVILHGDLDKKIFIFRFKGFESKSKPDHVCFLKKSFYGPK